jgi:hypothetical protein
VDADDHRGRHVRLIEQPGPPRQALAVAGEHDRLGRTGRDVHRDLPPTVVVEHVADELSRCPIVRHRTRFVEVGARVRPSGLSI